MNLPFDPAEPNFWDKISVIPDFSRGEEIRLKQMIFQPGAVYKLGSCLAAAGADPIGPLLVVMDGTPMRRGQDSLKDLVSTTLVNGGWPVEPVVVPPDESGQVHASVPAASFVKERIRPGAAVLSLGSGSITDIAKYGCFLWEKETGQRIPLVAVQTANSVTAFTSNMSVLFMDGVKRTVPSRYPEALVCDLETLRDAPYEMTAGGVGDMLAGFISYPDWYLAYRFGMDPSYSELVLDLLGPVDDILCAEAEGIKDGRLESVAVLAKLISLAGIGMSLMHATTPLSGFEHVISHVLDMQAEVEHKPLAQHGTQVALATLMVSEVYRHLLGELDAEIVVGNILYPPEDRMKKEIESAFSTLDPSGKVAAECFADYRKKLAAWNSCRDLHPAVLGDWQVVSERIRRDTRDVKRLAGILKAVNSPIRWAQLQPPLLEEQIKFAFLNAPLMRKRLTVGDLLIFFNWDREKLWQQVWEATQNL